MMKYNNFWDLHTEIMSKIKNPYVSATDPEATKIAVVGAIRVLDEIGALVWPLDGNKNQPPGHSPGGKD